MIAIVITGGSQGLEASLKVIVITMVDSTLSTLTHAYATHRISAEELYDGLTARDPAFFSTSGGEFKKRLRKELLAHNAKSPQERVRMQQAFFEVFYDRVAGEE